MGKLVLIFHVLSLLTLFKHRLSRDLLSVLHLEDSEACDLHTPGLRRLKIGISAVCREMARDRVFEDQLLDT